MSTPTAEEFVAALRALIRAEAVRTAALSLVANDVPVPALTRSKMDTLDAVAERYAAEFTKLLKGGDDNGTG